jgi:AraC-type DNA-binding domain-containing proteins
MIEGNYYLAYFPAGPHFLQLEAGICMVVQIELATELSVKLSATYYGFYEAYNRILENVPEGIMLSETWINPQICDALSKMMFCPLEDELGALYQETRMRDLLLLYTDPLADEKKKMPGKFRFSDADINAILDAGKKQIQQIENTEFLKDIARKSHLHPKKMQAGFRVVYGKSHTELLIETRMNEAKRLLKETDKPVTEIAHEVGYCNASAFIRAFKRSEGITPHQYR